MNAVLLYLGGVSMNRIAFLVRVSAQAVLNWIRAFAKEYQERPEPTGRTIVLNAMRRGMTSRRNATNSGSGKRRIMTPDGYLTGNVDAGTERP